jgi:hypothetical protein
MARTTVATIAAIAIAGAAAASAAAAEPLRYLGKESRSATGWIEFGHGRYYEVGRGTEIPAWGRVTDIDDEHLVVESVATQWHKREARQRGALVHDILQIHIPRDDLRQPSAEPLPAPPPR